jgi:hypothetical protein
MQMLATLRRFALRWAAALIGLCCGWICHAAGWVVYAPSEPWRALKAAAVMAVYFVAAWFMVGLPLAFWGPRLNSKIRIASASVVSGWIGLLIGYQVIGGLHRPLLPQLIPYLFYPNRFWFLTFVPAAVSMVVYCVICRAQDNTPQPYAH